MLVEGFITCSIINSVKIFKWLTTVIFSDISFGGMCEFGICPTRGWLLGWFIFRRIILQEKRTVTPLIVPYRADVKPPLEMPERPVSSVLEDNV